MDATMTHYTADREDMAASFPWKELTAGELIGTGAYGAVYRVSVREKAESHADFSDGAEPPSSAGLSAWSEKEYAVKYIRVPHDQEEKAALLRLLGDEKNVKEYCREAVLDLQNEIRILEKLKNHPNIVSVKDHRILETETGFELYILMEYLLPLPVYETTHVMTEQDALRLGIDICNALEICEKESILHRDLKPDNILVTKDGTCKVCDFGVARNLEKTFSAISIKGTFSYMAPEVYHGKNPDHRSDLYSLGMILYRMMNRGKDPFLAPEQRMLHYGEREEALNRRMNGEALPPPSDASDGFSEILLKACAWYPDQRYASASEFKEDLLRLQKGEYKIKDRDRRKYAKRGRAFYLKAAALMICLLAAAGMAASLIMYEYREHFVDYCDPVIRKKLMEEYHFTPQARLNGNGTLYIEKDEDLYCTRTGAEYPWMFQKDRIKKIVFGENVTGLDWNKGDGSEDVFIYAEDKELQYYGNMPHYNPRYVSEDLFRYCRNLEEISFQGSSFLFNTLDPFRGNDSLKAVSCSPDTLVEIASNGDNPFLDTPWIRLDGFCTAGATLFRYNGSEKYMNDFPENITRIENGAFQDNKEVEAVFLPEGVRIIGANAFSGCSALKQVEFPEGLMEIRRGAFEKCSSLIELQLPSGIETIEYSAFRGCKNLSDLSLSPENGFYTIDNGVLYNKDRTELLWCSPGRTGELRIPETVAILDDGALEDCSGVTDLVFCEGAAGLTFSDLFGSCPALTSMTVPESNPCFVLEDGMLYTKDKTQLYFCLRNTSGSITVPDGVVVIKNYAFCNCKEITRILLPDSVRYIFNNAFSDCTSLQSITLPSRMSLVSNDTFLHCTALKDLFFKGSENDWKLLTARFNLGLEEGTELHFGD